MSKYNYEHGYILDQTKRFFVEQLRRLVGTRVRQQLTYIATCFIIGALLFALVDNTWARSLLAVAPSLGTATSFTVLAGSTATNTGLTTVAGDLGVSPGTAITGFPPGVVVPPATIHAADAVALQAQSDVTTAYNNAAGQACDVNLTGQDLGGLTLTPGVYCFPSTSAQLTGALTLDGGGDPAAVFIFQTGSTITTASNATVLLINGASDCNVFWQIGSSATLGTGTAFIGNILALTSITLNTNASLLGRALAQNGAVTMDANSISSLCTLAAPTNTPTPTPLTPIATDTSTPDPLTPTPNPLTPTPNPLTPTPNLLTPTPNPLTPTPNLLTPTPDPLTPTPNLLTPTANPLTPTVTATPTPLNADFPPTGLDPSDEPNAAVSTLYLPLVAK